MCTFISLCDQAFGPLVAVSCGFNAWELLRIAAFVPLWKVLCYDQLRISENPGVALGAVWKGGEYKDNAL